MLFLYIAEMHPACFVFPMPLLLYGKLYSLNLHQIINFIYFRWLTFFLLMAFFLRYIDVSLLTPKIADKVN
jgi:hypothetical protein